MGCSFTSFEMKKVKKKGFPCWQSNKFGFLIKMITEKHFLDFYKKSSEVRKQESKKEKRKAGGKEARKEGRKVPTS